MGTCQRRDHRQNCCHADEFVDTHDLSSGATRARMVTTGQSRRAPTQRNVLEITRDRDRNGVPSRRSSVQGSQKRSKAPSSAGAEASLSGKRSFHRLQPQGTSLVCGTRCAIQPREVSSRRNTENAMAAEGEWGSDFHSYRLAASASVRDSL